MKFVFYIYPVHGKIIDTVVHTGSLFELSVTYLQDTFQNSVQTEKYI